MGFTFVQGNIFMSRSTALVNPVNCEGVMGAGLAKQFRGFFPYQTQIYTLMAKNNLVRPGKVLIVEHGLPLIVHFPTKDRWRDPSHMEWIQQGLDDLAGRLGFYNIRSISIPALGCGPGDLHWNDVKDEITKRLTSTKPKVVIYEPRKVHNGRERT